MTPRARSWRENISTDIVTWRSDVARRVGGLGGRLPLRVTAAARARARAGPRRRPRSRARVGWAPPRESANAHTRAHTHTHVPTRAHAHTHVCVTYAHTRQHTKTQSACVPFPAHSTPRGRLGPLTPRPSLAHTLRPVFASSIPPVNSLAAPPARALPSVRWRARARAPTHAPEAGGPDAVARQRSFPAKTKRSHTGDRCRMQKRKRLSRRDVVGPLLAPLTDRSALLTDCCNAGVWRGSAPFNSIRRVRHSTMAAVRHSEGQ